MTKSEISNFIKAVKSGEINEESAFKFLKNYPFEDIGCAKIDRQRELRNGVAEVIYGAGKSQSEIRAIVLSILKYDQNILITRTNREIYELLSSEFENVNFNERGNTISITPKPLATTQSYIAIVSAGTSDAAVVEEAYETAKILGNSVVKISDIGVAGIHRLFLNLETIQKAKVIIAVAGMEGALPSVVAGLVKAPVIAVPTSVGYGASFGGVAALLGMLNSCANGISVVNIDNGYGAAYNASIINHL
ncbi:nickel pincer cofactor biosynthesis protein LarB [Campylobacter sp. RM9344]|uniref:Nickel pincer cofactor biosynthesis protein LarB n=1 Tax=Campylobacter californiensis TaxID=1032243 RepID=A0AAW3ZRX8_9BACT|nr:MULTISPECIES: nickel pincer cofactor biosynthesis protein LarB [unclassified Campylobacter]MBE2984430.1 nickel pincer cofactor biosynthesis protein LarB [Campylobacter sp. RM6883]MBE2995040.1 nickel pincer cofactor biosynthesis protein LarB [Campylobacter sp. RM6913]MBE3021816.1 nickel pincer cofactor biosynthesis protein LarB [Campylobacter sp. 7477a]MBE3028869.1 nickel pincer cofactor biosynthesis protein LarB [Campylobacter sp. RM9344]MBE3607227.1 nickel pincer cofactor biosynthesis prot